MSVTADALDLLAGDPPRYPHVEGDFHRHPETGAPYVDHPTETKADGTPKRVMYGRPSSFGSALDNPFSLIKWKDREELVGAAILELDYEYILANRDNKKVLDGVAADCYDAAGSHLAADQGTHIHRLCEYCDRGRDWTDLYPVGEALGISKALQAQIINQWYNFRKRLGLRALAIERTVVNDRWRLAGTLDRLDVADHDILTAYGVLEAGQPFVGDIKTGGLTLGNDGQPNYWVKFPVQLAAYVDAVPYDTDTDERGEWICSSCSGSGETDQKCKAGGDACDGGHVCRHCHGLGHRSPHREIALIYHYDLARALAGEVVDWAAIPVNVDAGREGGDLCRAAADFAKRRDLFAMPAPTIAAVGSGNSEASEGRLPHESAVPVAPNAVVEQQAADPEPSTASTAVPGTAADFNVSTIAAHIPMTPEAWRGLGGRIVAAERGHLINRLSLLVVAGHEQLIRRHWPEGVPTLKHDGHSDAQLQLILACVRRVEAEVGAGWHPDDGPPPHSRLAIQRALKAWEGRDVGTAWFAASLIATFEQCRNADATLEELVAQFTISQADAFYDAAQTK